MQRFKIQYEDENGFIFSVWRSTNNINDLIERFSSQGYNVINIEEQL